MIEPQLSLEEVGAILGIDRKAVWYIEKQAFKKLRKRLAHLQENEPTAKCQEK